MAAHKHTAQEYAQRGPIRYPADLHRLPAHKESKERFYSSAIRVVKRLLRAQGITVTAFGADNVPAHGGAVLAMNHTGYYDFIFGGVPAHLRGRRLVRFMAKKEIFDVPVVGRLMNWMGHVPVDRFAGASSIDAAVAHLRSGDLVGIFPEATISRSFELKDFKNGAARIAAAAEVPLVPMACWGSQRIWTKGGKKNLGRTNTPVFIKVGPPIDQSGTPEDVIARLKVAMGQLLDEVREAYDQEFGPFEPGLEWRPASMGGNAPTLDDANRADAAYRTAKLAEREKKAAQAAAKAERKADRKLAKRARRQLEKLAKMGRRQVKHDGS